MSQGKGGLIKQVQKGKRIYIYITVSSTSTFERLSSSDTVE
jgi:hypothetical protein